jgi:TolB protein
MRLSILKFLLFCWVTASALNAAKNIGEAVRSGSQQLSLTLEAQDPVVLQLANRAFTLHGGVRLVHETQAQYRAQFAWVSDQTLRVSVLDDQEMQLLAPRLIQAVSRRQAVLRACDFVVESLYRRPGFFAGQLAFVVKQAAASEIYTSDLLFSQVRPVTADRSLVTGPNWQPDGRGLLYTTYFKTGFPDIYHLDLEQRRRQVFAAYKGTNSGPAYSPTGTFVAMSLSNRSGSDLYVGDARGGGLRRLTEDKSLETSPDWSPDGRQLVFVSDRAGRPQLYRMNIAGSVPERIITQVSSYCSEPSWNPLHANLIAFTAAISGGFQIAVHDLKTGRSEVLTQERDAAVEPEWLNDGRHLVMTIRRAGKTRLALLDTWSQKSIVLHSPKLGSASAAAFVYTLDD